MEKRERMESLERWEEGKTAEQEGTQHSAAEDSCAAVRGERDDTWMTNEKPTVDI